MTSGKFRAAAVPYLWAVIATVGGLGVRLLIDPILGYRIPYATFYIAVAVSAVLGGWRCGLLATLGGAFAALYFIIPPRYHPLSIIGADNQLGFALYLIVCAMLILLAEKQRKAKLRAESELATRQRVEARELDQQQQFEIILGSIGDGVIAVGSEGRVTFLNRIASELTGWTQEDALGRPVDEVFIIRDEETNAVIDNPALNAMRDGRMVNLANHTVLYTRTGEQIPIGDSAAPILSASGELMGAVLVFRDVSEVRARELEQRQLKRLIDLSQAAIIVTDRERRIVSWNLGAKEMYGWDADEAVGQIIQALLKTLPEDVERKERALRQDGWWEGELKHVHKGGRPILCESRQVLTLDAQGNVQGMLEINRDITERKRIEEKLLESAKLESLGLLAGGIAHDFNNLLTGILGNASLLLDDAPMGSGPWSFAKGICESAERAAKLAHQMLAYSGRGHFIIESVRLSELVRQNTALLLSSISKNVQLTFRLSEDVPMINADVGQMQQLLVNVVINAAEAIGSAAGQVTITTRPQIVDETYRRIVLGNPHVPLGLYACLEVSDSGCGMDDETLTKIFDPFFTTKFVGRGLGLAAVQGIVRGHKGALKVESRVGEGTTFRILFPANGAASGDAHLRQIEAPAIGAGSILVIDDEDIVRTTAEAALRRLGYEVVTASDGAKGLEALSKHLRTIRLVLLDLSLPGLSGEETIAQIRSIAPNVPVLLSSGFNEAQAVRGFEKHRPWGFLQKPYTGQALAMRVREAIGRAESEEAGASEANPAENSFSPIRFG